MSSSQLTLSPWFFRGAGQPPTYWNYKWIILYPSSCQAWSMAEVADARPGWVVFWEFLLQQMGKLWIIHIYMWSYLIFFLYDLYVYTYIYIYIHIICMYIYICIPHDTSFLTSYWMLLIYNVVYLLASKDLFACFWSSFSRPLARWFGSVWDGLKLPVGFGTRMGYSTKIWDIYQ